MRGVRGVCVLALVSVGLVACGGDDDDGADAPTTDVADAADSADTAAAVSATDPAPATDAVDATAAASDPTTAAPTSAPSEAPAATQATASGGGDAPAGDGSDHCSVSITGAVEAEWTNTSTGPAILYVRDWVAGPGAEEEGSFALNCVNTDFSLVGFSDSGTVDIPVEPATYEVTGDFASDPIHAEVALLSDEGFWEVTSGTLEFTVFNDSTLVGSFSLTIEDDFDTSRVAQVTGEFSYSN